MNVAGAGIVSATDDGDAAERFLEFLLSEDGQRFYAEEAEEAEYRSSRGSSRAMGYRRSTSSRDPTCRWAISAASSSRPLSC